MLKKLLPPPHHINCSGGIAAAAQALDSVQAAGPVRVVGRGRRGGRAGEPRRRRRGAHGRAEPLRSPHLCRDHGRGAHAPALRSLRLRGFGGSARCACAVGGAAVNICDWLLPLPRCPLGFVLGTCNPRPQLARQLSRQQHRLPFAHATLSRSCPTQPAPFLKMTEKCPCVAGAWSRCAAYRFTEGAFAALCRCHGSRCPSCSYHFSFQQLL